ncbi:histidine kinase [Microbacterium sp.]|uniref:sensor histidine kinase n=1 Tax=Microbacterium sp. TaxID=51671 RepID=UPI002810ECBA|nr:histidine kinase [Microbacterium sp.]
MLQRTGTTGTRPLSTALGVVLLFVATSVTLPVARWGDSALVLLLVPSVIAGYIVGRRMRGLSSAVITILTALALMLPVSYLLPGGAPLGDWMTGALIALLTVVAAWWVGRYQLLRARQRESDAAVLADRAQAEERARIADDLHDTIGHELALIAVQAGALELGRGLSAPQQLQFQELRAAAVRASERLREVVQLAGPNGPGRLAPVGGESIDVLAAGARDAGMSVSVASDRQALTAVHPLIAELAVRVVREGLTNAARHAPGAEVEIAIVRGDTDAGSPADADGIVVSVRSGRPSADAGASHGSGHGISSLRRRAELLGATIAARPDDGGFELILRAPATPAPATGSIVGTADAELRANARATRRSLLQTAAVPGSIVVLAIAGFLAVQAITVAQTAVSSETYEGIELGATRSALSPVLPGGIPRPAPVVDEPALPTGAQCEYFAARDGWLHFTDATYRLCFRDGVLVQKLHLEAS